MADEALAEDAHRRLVNETRDDLLVASLAYTAATPTVPPKADGNHRFGVHEAAKALRLLADAIDDHKVAVQDLQEVSRAYCDDFTMTALTVVYAKRVKE